MIKEKVFFLVFFVLQFFQKIHNKKQSREQDDLSLMVKIHKAKNPKQVHFCLGWDERIFFEKHKATHEHNN